MPRPSSWVARCGIACALVLSLFRGALTEAQHVGPPWLVLRAVSVTDDPALTPDLRAAIEESLASLPDDARSPRTGYVLDARVTRLSASTSPGGRRVDCEVSVVLEDAQRHAVRAVLTGRAAVVGDESPTLARTAVRAAARGALRSLPTALTPAR